MVNEKADLERPTMTSVSRFRAIGTAAALGALVACSSSLEPGGAGGAGGTACTTAAASARGGGANGFAALSGAPGTGATGGGAGSGTGAWCGNNPAPTAEPFNCQPTYAQELPLVCTSQAIPYARKQAGSCQSLQVISFGTGFYTIWCAYDTTGALVVALRCEDTSVYCDDSSIKSANAQAELTRCDPLSNVCDAEAGCR
jgi:hypothetical protein